MENNSTTARDDRTLEIYLTVAESNGITTADIARKIEVTPQTVLIDLHYLAKCELIEKRGHLWHWCKKTEREDMR